MKLNEFTIKRASQGLHKKEFSVTELVSECLKAINKKDQGVHAYLDVFDDALKEAKKADEMLQNNPNLPPLFGIPLAVKDNILLADKNCTAGSKILGNYTASYDATVIHKLRNQGALFLGKTNLDEFAMGSSTENSAFGPTRNPHDLSRVPGGSSGGSAAAVAADMCVAALGSDTGGSIRQPASFCGVVGFKPTYGRVSRHGLMAMASSLDQIGPITKTVEDTKLLFHAISGEDKFDSTTIKINYDSGITNYELKNTKVGVPREYFTAGLDPEVEKIIKSAVGKMEGAGAKIQEVSLPHSQYALPAYYIIVPSEISANLARYDGIRYGQRAREAETLLKVYSRSRAEGLGSEVKRRIMLGTYALSAGYYDAYYLQAQKVRRLIRQDFERAFENVNLIVGPTTPTPAFKFGEKIHDPLQMYLADIYTVALNLAGLPGISIPAGFTGSTDPKLPVGIQLVGNFGEDEKLLDIAAKFEEIIKS